MPPPFPFPHETSSHRLPPPRRLHDVPRSLAKSGLDFEKLRAIYHRHAGGRGESKTALAAEYGVSLNTLSYHLKNGGSPSMKAALADDVPAAAA